MSFYHLAGKNKFLSYQEIISAKFPKRSKSYFSKREVEKKKKKRLAQKSLVLQNTFKKMLSLETGDMIRERKLMIIHTL